MADREINISYNINTAAGIQNMKRLNEAVDENIKSISSLESESERLRDALKGVEIGSEEFKRLGSELKSVESQLKDIDLQFEALDFEQRLTAATDVAAGIAGGFAAAQGAIALAGVESEEFEQTMIRVQGAMALAMGVRDIGVAISALQKLNVVTKVVTATQRVFNLVLTLWPIGLIIAAVGALIAAFLLIPNAIEKVVNWFDNLGKAAKITITILGGPFIAAAILAREAAKALGLVESEEEKAARERSLARQKRLREEIDTLKERKKEIQESAKARIEAADEAVGAIDFELRKARAAGKETAEIERDKIKATLNAIDQRIKALEDELEVEIQIAQKRIQLNREMFGELDGEFDVFGRRLEDTDKKALSGVSELEKQLNELRDNRKKSEQDLTIFEIEQEKQRTDSYKKASQDRLKLQEDEEARLREMRQERDKFYAEQDAKRAEEERKRREQEAEQFLAQQDLLDDLRIENIQDQFERERQAREAEFSKRIAELSNQGLLTNEIRKELEIQLSNDLAEIDERSNAEKLERERETADAIAEIERAAFSISESLISLAIDNEKKADRARKILAGAQLAVDTAKAISGAVAQAQSVPFPGNLAAIATGVATVLANIAQAKQLLQSSGVSNLPSVSGAGNGGGGAPRVNPVTSGSTLRNTQDDTRVFVVESDISTTQKKVKTIENQATI